MTHPTPVGDALAAAVAVWPDRPHLLELETLPPAAITALLDLADAMAAADEGSLTTLLRGQVAVNLFFEDSTRTRTSFSLAARKLGANVVEFSAKTSSLSKGESFLDTAANLQALGGTLLVVRHSCPGAPHLLARHVGVGVLNAGDGAHEHPTQGLLDLLTIRRRKGTVAGLTVALVGDIAHSRVARSNLWGLKHLGANVILCGPRTLLPPAFARLGFRCEHDLDRVLPECDVVNILRVQFERQRTGYFPSVREYTHLFGMTEDRLHRAKDDVLILAPGPINRGAEISPAVADSPNSAILEQVTNGVAVRMAALAVVDAARRRASGETHLPRQAGSSRTAGGADASASAGAANPSTA